VTGRSGQRCVLLPVPGSGRLADLLGHCRVELVFTAAERRLSRRRGDLSSWAGRLAAKLAVLELFGRSTDSALVGGLDLGWTSIEVLPSGPGQCADPLECRGTHRPEVFLRGSMARWLGPDERLAVSISHTDTLAAALVARVGVTGAGTAGTPERRHRRC